MFTMHPIYLKNIFYLSNAIKFYMRKTNPAYKAYMSLKQGGVIEEGNSCFTFIKVTRIYKPTSKLHHHNSTEEVKPFVTISGSRIVEVEFAPFVSSSLLIDLP